MFNAIEPVGLVEEIKTMKCDRFAKKCKQQLICYGTILVRVLFLLVPRFLLNECSCQS